MHACVQVCVFVRASSLIGILVAGWGKAESPWRPGTKEESRGEWELRRKKRWRDEKRGVEVGKRRAEANKGETRERSVQSNETVTPLVFRPLCSVQLFCEQVTQKPECPVKKEKTPHNEEKYISSPSIWLFFFFCLFCFHFQTETLNLHSSLSIQLFYPFKCQMVSSTWKFFIVAAEALIGLKITRMIITFSVSLRNSHIIISILKLFTFMNIFSAS